ncbi:hypothetical protein JCM11641_002534 [Rhodosporidiobolus odoratus]
METVHKTNLLDPVNTKTNTLPDPLPLPLPQPPQPPVPSAHADLPSVAALSLNGRHHPVEPQLPVNLVSDATMPPASQSDAPLTRPIPDVPQADHAYSYPPPPSREEDGSLPYPAETPHLTRAPVVVACKDPTVGRGVFATADIPAGQVVEISPVLVLSEEEYTGRKKSEPNDGALKGVEASQLRGYVFSWGRNGSMAVALGLGSLFNHSSSPNVSYSLDSATYTITYRTAKPVQAGEELTIFYGHSVRFAGSSATSPSEAGVPDDEWGGLGGVDALSDGGDSDQDIDGLKRLSQQELFERDNEVLEFTDEGFPWRKITNIIDPEDRTLTTMPCYAMTISARHSAIVFAFVRKYTSRRFNELGHLKRVKPIPVDDAASRPRSPKSPASSASSSGSGSECDDSFPSTKRPRATSIRTEADSQQQVLLFPVATAPVNLDELLAASPFAVALGDSPMPKIYVVDVPAQPAHTEEQARDWSTVWPVTIVHIREGAKATRRKRGWERAKMEWIEREARRAWDKAEEAGRRGEYPIACHVTDSWYPGFHGSFNRPITLVNTFDTRKSTGNTLAHAACNAIDAVGILDLHDGRPELARFSPDAADPPYLLTGLSVFMSHEPCLLCAMSLLHSRIKSLYFMKPAPGAGGCGSLYNVHEDGGLNHRFEVWEWIGPKDRGMAIGAGETLSCDP